MNIERVKEGLALVKMFGVIEHLDDPNYESEDVNEIMRHVHYGYDSLGNFRYMITHKGERILNDISMR